MVYIELSKVLGWMGSCLKFPPGLSSVKVHNIHRSHLFFISWFKIMKTLQDCRRICFKEKLWRVLLASYYPRESHGVSYDFTGKLYDFQDQMTTCRPDNQNLSRIVPQKLLNITAGCMIYLYTVHLFCIINIIIIGLKVSIK